MPRIELAYQYISLRKPEASAYKWAAFANCVHNIMHWQGGTIGGPTCREYLVDALFVGRTTDNVKASIEMYPFAIVDSEMAGDRHVSLEWAYAFCEYHVFTMFEPESEFGQLLTKILANQDCFGDDPLDLEMYGLSDDDFGW